MTFADARRGGESGGRRNILQTIKPTHLTIVVPFVHSYQQLLGGVALRAQRPIVIKLSRERSVGRSVCLLVGLSVCPLHCGKTADRIRQPFGTIGRTGPRMRQVLGFANRSTGRGTFGGEFGPHHCNQWGLYDVRVRQCLNRRRCGLGWCLRWAEALLY